MSTKAPLLTVASLSGTPDLGHMQEIPCSGNALIDSQMIHLVRYPRPAQAG